MAWEGGDGWPDYYNDSYWYNYSSWTNLNTSQQLCAYQENVSCYTEGNWVTMWSDWRIIANFTCYGNYTYNESCYYFFHPEECSIFYIHPPSPNSTVCPCCDAMCVGINNELGHNMNITVYRNDTQFEAFYIVNQFLNVSNGTYCFCMDGHINDSIYYSMLYNTTYHWYVNVTDIVTSEYNISDVFRFTTAENLSDCPCGEEALEMLLADYSQKDYIIGLVGILGIIGLIGYFNRRRNR